MLKPLKRGKVYHADLIKGRVHVVRGSLGTRSADVAHILIHRVERALALGPLSDDWCELERSLPPRTYQRFASYAGVKRKGLATWVELRAKFEQDLQERRKINNLSESYVGL